MSQRRSIPPALLVPIIPGAILLVSRGLYAVLIGCRGWVATADCRRPESLTVVPFQAALSPVDLVGRVAWGTAATTLVVASAAAIAICLWIVYATRREVRAPLPWLPPLAAVVAGVSILGVTLARADPHVEAFLVPTVGSVVYVRELAGTATSIAYTAAVCVVLALTVLAWPLRGSAAHAGGGAAPDGSRRAAVVATLRQRAQRLEIVLYLGAAVLVASVITTGAMYGWVGTFFPADSEVRAEIQNLGSTLVIAISTIYTLVLAGSYFPAFLMLRHEALAAAALHPVAPPADGAPQELTEREREEWLDATGMASPPIQRLAHLAAILGPVLVGGPGQALLRLVA